MANANQKIFNTYDSTTIMLHWITVALVITLFSLAEGWGFLPPGTPFRRGMQALHVSLGILLTAVVLIRIGWRVTRGRRLPAVPSRIPYWMAEAVHYVLYVLLLTQIVLGFLFRWTQGEPFTFFGLISIPALLAPNKGIASTVGGLHDFIAWTIIILALSHAAAALFHQYVLKDGILKRMIPGLK